MADKVMQYTPQCPTCKRTGPMSLVLAVMRKPGSNEKGNPCVECLGCHAYFSIGDLATNILEFFIEVPVIVN